MFILFFKLVQTEIYQWMITETLAIFARLSNIETLISARGQSTSCRLRPDSPVKLINVIWKLNWLLIIVESAVQV